MVGHRNPDPGLGASVVVTVGLTGTARVPATAILTVPPSSSTFRASTSDEHSDTSVDLGEAEMPYLKSGS
jgi:hypothetical protein